MPAVLPQNEKYLRDAFGNRRFPDSAYWDGWFSVTPTRKSHPLRGMVMNGVITHSHPCRAGFLITYVTRGAPGPR